MDRANGGARQPYWMTVIVTLGSRTSLRAKVPPSGTSEEPPPPLPGCDPVQKWLVSLAAAGEAGLAGVTTLDER